MFNRHPLLLTITISLLLPAIATAATPEIQIAGDTFRFVILTDPTIEKHFNRSPIGEQAQHHLESIAKELNHAAPRPAFALILGDALTECTAHETANFFRLKCNFDFPFLLAQGPGAGGPLNPAWPTFQQTASGLKETAYSFDLGAWHFIVLPAQHPNALQGLDSKTTLLDFLKNDLKEHQTRPTCCFYPIPCLPTGLTRAEAPPLARALRNDLLSTLTQYNNVKYVFSAGIHTTIQAAEKTAWKINTTTFLTCPAILPPDPFGEEYPAFKTAQETGGYYLLIDINADKLSITAHAAGIKTAHPLNLTARPFTDDLAPRWRQAANTYKKPYELINPSFENALDGWRPLLRYQHTSTPHFVYDTVKHPKGNALHLKVTPPAAPPSPWATDEYLEAWQAIKLRSPNPILSMRYQSPSRPLQGGGYLRVALFRDDTFLGLLFFYWGEETAIQDTLAFPQSIGYDLKGQAPDPAWLQALSQEKKALFINLPQPLRQWNTLKADIAALWDTAQEQEGAFAALWVNTLIIAPGLFADLRRHGQSEAWFDEITLDKIPATSSLNGERLRPSPKELLTNPFSRDALQKIEAAKKAANTQK